MNDINSIAFKGYKCFDVFRIRSVEEFLVEIDPILENNGFKFKTNEIEDVDFSINDPEPLKTQQFMKHKENIISYEYVDKLDGKLVINEYIILIERRGFENKRTVSDDINMLSKIIGKLAEMERISIERIGVRKINREIGGNLNELLKSFKLDEINIEDVKNSANYTKTSKEMLEDVQANPKDTEDMEMTSTILLKELVKGTIHVNGKDVEAYMAVANIDVYQRQVCVGVNKNDIELKLNKLANCICKIRDERLKICYDKKV